MESAQTHVYLGSCIHYVNITSIGCGSHDDVNESFIFLASWVEPWQRLTATANCCLKSIFKNVEQGAPGMHTVQPSVSDHPKYKDHSRLQEVVSYENRTIRGLFQEVARHVYFLADNFSKLHTSVVPLCYWKFFIYSEWPSSYSEQRDHMMCLVVAYKRLQTTKNYKTIMPISGRSRLWEVIVYKRFTHGKILVFWIAGA